MRVVRILMVEDDVDVAGMYRLKLESEGFAVHVATAGEVGLAMASRCAWDLVLLDMGLPGMDGLQVLAALRGDPRTSALHVVVLSSGDDPDVIERCMELGAIAYLVKIQTTPAQLSGGVRRWAARPDALARPVPSTAVPTLSGA